MKYPAIVTPDCELAFYDKQGLTQDLYDYRGKNVWVEVKHTSQISVDQHRLYRGTMLDQILEAIEHDSLVEFPEEYSKRMKKIAIHWFLKKMFLTTRLKTKMGADLEFIPSMADLTKADTAQYYEQISAWFSATFKRAIQMPEKSE